MGKLVKLVTIAALFVSVNFTGSAQQERNPKPADLVVHEWGTFTSVSNVSGASFEWRTLTGSDLPDFVYSIDKPDYKHQTRDSAFEKSQSSKSAIQSYQRMETPVTYFYTDREMDAEVSVSFPKGLFTEWYPHVRTYSPDNTKSKTNGLLRWGKIKLLPETKELAKLIPNGKDQKNHYYHARETDSALVRVCNTGELGTDKVNEYEKFLFYRGVSDFEVPLKVKLLENNQIEIQNKSKEEIKHIFRVNMAKDESKFEFTCMLKSLEVEQKGHHVYKGTKSEMVDKLSDEMEKCLIMEGLYKKEAKAMVKSWRDSWFEEDGTRVFYILPQKTTDAVLPITINPKPKEIVRVMVGRIECITPEQEKQMKSLINSYSTTSCSRSRASILVKIQEVGRFADPIIRSIKSNGSTEEVKKNCDKILELID